MRFRSRFSKLIFCAMLATASITGLPMRAEEVEELMHSMNRQTIVYTLDDEREEPKDQDAE